MRRPEVGILAFAILALACAIPTDAPNWDMTWNVPVPDKNGLSVDVTSFLPSGVTAVGTPPTSFKANVGSLLAISQTLASYCPACPNATAPKPAFSAAPTTTISLAAAANLTSATIAAGSQLSIVMNNGFSFDPIRPPGGANGSITFTITNGVANTIGSVVFSGATSAIPAGAATTLVVPLNAGATITNASPITVTMTLDSPAGAIGSPVAMSTTAVFSATPTATVLISAATVSIPAQTVAASATPMDLSNIDSSIIKRIQNDTLTRGSMFLTITNPFTVGGAMNVTFTSPPGTPAGQAITPISKALTLPPATNGTTPVVATLTINFTGIELRKILGHNLNVAFGGTTAAGSLTVTPAQKITATSRLQLNFTIREQ